MGNASQAEADKNAYVPSERIRTLLGDTEFKSAKDAPKSQLDALERILRPMTPWRAHCERELDALKRLGPIGSQGFDAIIAATVIDSKSAASRNFLNEWFDSQFKQKVCLLERQVQLSKEIEALATKAVEDEKRGLFVDSQLDVIIKLLAKALKSTEY